MRALRPVGLVYALAVLVVVVGVAARQLADQVGPITGDHTGARWVAAVVSPVLLGLALAAARTLAARPPRWWLGLLDAVDEQQPGWQRRRFLVVVAPYGCALTLLVLASRYVSERLWWCWRAFGVLPLKDPDGSGRPYRFEDFAHLYAAARCHVAVHPGADVCDPFGRRFNQNPLWIHLLRPFASVLPLWLLGLVVGLVAILTCGAIAALTPRGVVGVVPFMASPAFALGVERANHDLLLLPLWGVAVVLIAAGQTRGQLLGGVLGLAAVVLKVFPLLGFVPLVANRGRRTAWVAMGVGVAGAAYWLWHRHVLSAMVKATSRGALKSYGARSVARVIGGHVPAFGVVDFVWTLTLITAVVFLGVWWPAGSAARRWTGGPLQVLAVSGIAVYVGTFFLIENWSYRIVFSVPVVAALTGPFVAAWAARAATVLGVGLFGFVVLSPTAWSWAFQVAYAAAALAILALVALGREPWPVALGARVERAH